MSPMNMSITGVFLLVLLLAEGVLSLETTKPALVFEYETNVDTEERKCSLRPKIMKTVYTLIVKVSL
jgi:hypothetical protein